MIYSQKQIDRFWANVDVGDAERCWHWKLSTNSGYGQVALGGRILKAHKVAWEIHNDAQIPIEGRATHSCGSRLCCNPRHVVVWPREFLANEGLTGARGESHGNAKLTERQVRLVKYRLNTLTTREIADTMRVSFHTIWDIRKGVTWRHI